MFSGEEGEILWMFSFTLGALALNSWCLCLCVCRRAMSLLFHVRSLQRKMRAFSWGQGHTAPADSVHYCLADHCHKMLIVCVQTAAPGTPYIAAPSVAATAHLVRIQTIYPLQMAAGEIIRLVCSMTRLDLYPTYQGHHELFTRETFGSRVLRFHLLAPFRSRGFTNACRSDLN